MAAQQQLLMTAANGRISVSVTYDDVTLAIASFLVTNTTNQAVRPSITLKAGLTVSAAIAVGSAVVPVSGQSMVNAIGDSGQTIIVLPAPLELSVPFAGDAP